MADNRIMELEEELLKVTEKVNKVLKDLEIVTDPLKESEEYMKGLNKRLETAETTASSLEAKVTEAVNSLRGKNGGDMEDSIRPLSDEIEQRLSEAIKSEDTSYKLEGELDDKDKELVRAREEYSATKMDHENLIKKLEGREERAWREEERDAERREMPEEVREEMRAESRELEEDLKEKKAVLEEYETKFKEAKRKDEVLQRDIQRKSNKEESLWQRANVLEDAISQPNADELILLKGQLKAANIRAEGAVKRREVVECALDEVQVEIDALNQKKERLEKEMIELALMD